MPSRQPIPPQLAAALGDGYVVERELGRGGMATVYLARDLRHHRHVAVKVLEPELAAAIGPERFHREIRIAAGLQHPHILPVFDSGTANGLTWYVMPFVEGESLRDLLQRQHTLAVDRAIAIAREVADALDHAHARGVVHRDIKPENILLSGGHALVADFGIARSDAGDARTATGLAIGTPAYMSPEQASAEPDVDGRTDIYSLGCVLYEMLIGEAPYSGPTPLAVLARRLTEPVPSPRRVRSSVPASVDAAVQRALATKRSDRFATGGDLARALTAADHEVIARHATKVLLPRRVALAALAFALVGGGGAFVAKSGLLERGSAADVTPVLSVLPFRNLGESADEYFADGLTEEIASRLAHLPRLVLRRGRVPPGSLVDGRTAMQIGREHGAAYVLTGTVQWSAAPKGGGSSRIRVTPRLVRLSDGRELLGQTIDASFDDVFKVQSGIAEQVSRALGIVLAEGDRARLARSPTERIEAWDHFQRGNYHLARRTPDAVRRAIDEYEIAFAIDSGFTRALVRRAYAYTLFVDWGWHYEGHTAPELLRLAAAAVTQALARDSTSADAWLTQAYLRAVEDPYRLDGALAAFRRTLALDSTSAEVWHQYGQTLMLLGHDSEAVAAYHKTLSLEPERPMTLVPLSAIARQHGQQAEARRFADSALTFRGVSTPYARVVRGLVLLASGDAAGARRDAEVALATDSSYAVPARSLLISALARTGDTTGAVRELERLRTSFDPRAPSATDARYVVPALLAVGRHDEAMDLLERVRPRAAMLWFYLKSPDFDAVRSDPRFARVFQAADPRDSTSVTR